jgi:hypothetical protein
LCFLLCGLLVHHPTVSCAQLYALHRIQRDEAEVIPLYSVQSIKYSGIIHKEENRISTDVRAATDEKSRNTDHPSDNQGNALAPCDSL